MGSDPFEVICELEPATTPELTRVREQMAVLRPVSSAFLVPDNHIGRATVSSIAVAREVTELGGRAIACLNARDRNTLGFRRDLLTAAAYGVESFLFVYGDRPEKGHRSDDLTVRTMLHEARTFSERLPAERARWRIGVATGLRAVPDWKLDADLLFAQVSFSADRLVAWRASIEFAGPVYAGVMVVPSAARARKLGRDVPELAVPSWAVDRLERDGSAGIDIACGLIAEIRASGAFDGIHLVPVRHYREMARRLPRLP